LFNALSRKSVGHGSLVLIGEFLKRLVDGRVDGRGPSIGKHPLRDGVGAASPSETGSMPLHSVD
jgi:hypothetical protein